MLKENDIFNYYENLRLTPNHDISQWYMNLVDAKTQVEFLIDNIKGNIVFLGDGDGIAILLALMCKVKKNSISEILVLDIDERELNLYKQIAKENNIKNFKTKLYNIFDKLPQELKNKYKNFYINPPYSSTTQPKGLGFILWLERCIELSVQKANGIIVYPYEDENDNKWLREIQQNLMQYLTLNNFEIQTTKAITHKYHEITIISSNIFVQLTPNTFAFYQDKQIPLDIARSLYHNNLPMPHYVKDDGSKLGQPIYY